MASPSFAETLALDWEQDKRDGALFFDPAAMEQLSDGEVAAMADRLEDKFDRDIEAIQARIRAAKRPFVATWPALTRWRDGVLAAPRRHPPAVVAAALEAVALECDLSGYPELAQKARAEAEALVLRSARAGSAP